MKRKVAYAIICSLAIASLSHAKEEEKKSKKAKEEHTQRGHHGGSTTGPKPKPGPKPPQGPKLGEGPQKPQGEPSPPVFHPQPRPIPFTPEHEANAKSHGFPNAAAMDAYAQSQGFRNLEEYVAWKETGKIPPHDPPPAAPPPKPVVNAPPKRTPQPPFFVPRKVDGMTPILFKPHQPIAGSPDWKGDKYKVFREYDPDWHDRDWWEKHSERIAFVFGGYYYLNARYWFPAWGYDPNVSYFYDRPIYAYSGLPPDQAVANVQAVLRELGYYHGPVHGWLDTATRGAIAAYQQDNGLYVTETVDEATLESLGMG